MTSQAVRNALDDLETAAERVEQDFESDVITECVDTLREELEE